MEWLFVFDRSIAASVCWVEARFYAESVGAEEAFIEKWGFVLLWLRRASLPVKTAHSPGAK
ncbi:hypothetical protein [Massilia phosphatilytica]